VHRWVTVFGRVNHLGTEPGTQAYSAWACAGWNEYLAKAGRVNRHITWHTSSCTWSRSVCWMPVWWLASGDQCRLMGSSSALETCSWWCAIQMAAFTYFTYFTCPLPASLTVCSPLLDWVMSWVTDNRWSFSSIDFRLPSDSMTFFLCSKDIE